MHFPRWSVLSSSSSPKSPSSSPKSPSSSKNRRLTRAKPLRFPRECDVNPINSPHRQADGFFRFSSPPSPHPLPLPDQSPLISAVDDNQISNSNSKSKRVGHSSFRLPSPTQVSKERETSFYSKPNASFAPASSTVVLQDGQRNDDAQRRANAQQGVDARVLARHSRHNSNYAETCSSWTMSKSMQGTRRTQQQLSIDITFRSAPTSLNSSPLRSPQTLFPLGSPRWSEEAISTGLQYAGFPESSKASFDASPCKGPLLKSPKPPRKSFSGPPSPLHPTLSVETSSPHHDGNFLVNGHPLPLPPTPSSVAASPVPQVTTTPEFLPFKNQWTKGKLIGCGTFGSVFVASNRETGALCAMKEVQLCPDDPKSAECMKQLEQEIKVLSHLKHPNIVQYYGSEIVDDKFYIYLEYVYPGSINKYIHEHCGAITEAVVRNFTRHILSGLTYLHSRKTIHRDIKGANLLVDASGVVKLADFGMAKHLTGQADVLSLKGSPYWMAPELMQAVIQKDNNSDLAFVVDIWSLGCTIIEMMTGKPPWNEFEGAAAMFKVLKESPPIPETLSSEGKDFLHCCFQRNPADRPPANKLLDHPFLKTSQQLDFPPSRLAPNLMTY